MAESHSGIQVVRHNGQVFFYRAKRPPTIIGVVPIEMKIVTLSGIFRAALTATARLPSKFVVLRC